MKRLFLALLLLAPAQATAGKVVSDVALMVSSDDETAPSSVVISWSVSIAENPEFPKVVKSKKLPGGVFPSATWDALVSAVKSDEPGGQTGKTFTQFFAHASSATTTLPDDVITRYQSQLDAYPEFTARRVHKLGSSPPSQLWTDTINYINGQEGL